MALATGALFEMRATATTGNVNAAYFNPGNSNFLTDFTATSATGNAPVISSASYNFVAGDVGAWIYVKAGTNWVSGFYNITSVASNSATVNATIGAAVQLNTSTNMYGANTVAGVATVATPSGGTCGVDYSQQDTAKVNAVADFTSVGASTTLTSATAGFTPVMPGNGFHQTTTGTGAHGVVGWYEIVSYTNATTVVLDRTSNDGTASVACTGYIGGAGRWNALEDAFLEAIPASSTVYTKSGSYTISGAISVASTTSTATLMSLLIGYTTLRGDTCTGTNRPLWTCAGNAVTFGQAQSLMNMRFTTTTTAGIALGAATYNINCQSLNSSTTASRAGFTNGATSIMVGCEGVGQNGVGISMASNNTKIFGCFAHDSVTGLSISGSNVLVHACISAVNSTAAVSVSGATPNLAIDNCTLYGREAKMGTGISLTTANSVSNFIFNSIIYGSTTGISVATGPAGQNYGVKLDFFNNTSDVSNWYKFQSSLALDPQFVGATQITGTTASGSGSTLTDTNADFSSVTDNVDYVRVLSGTGATVGCYLITGHTTTTLTCNNTVGTNATADRVYFVNTGTNYQIGTNLVNGGFPTFSASGSETVSYPVVGAAKPQSTSSTGGGSFTFS